MSQPFDPSKHLRALRTRGVESAYLDVKWRLVWLRTEHPDATIDTEHVHVDDQVAIFKARVAVPNGGAATGYGSETRADFPSGHVEKAETKAIGRALAALGYGTQFAQDFDEGDERDGSRNVADSPIARAPSANLPAQGRAEEQLATEKQVAFAESLADRTGMDEEELGDWAEELYKQRALARLTRAQVSDLINRLQDRSRARE